MQLSTAFVLFLSLTLGSAFPDPTQLSTKTPDQIFHDVISAIRTGNEEVAIDGIQSLTRSNNLNMVDDLGYTLLHWSALKGRNQIVDLLIKNGANLNIVDKVGKTALQKATESRNIEIVNLLAKNRADLNHTHGSKNRTALHLAAQKGRQRIAAILLQYGANANIGDTLKRTPLHVAARNNQEGVANLIINSQNGAEIELDKLDNENRTALHWAARLGFADVVDLLINSGADVNVRDKLQRTPLHLAAKNGRKEVTDMLLEDGAQIDLKDRRNKTALELAEENGFDDIAVILIDNGADYSSEIENDGDIVE